MNNVMTVARLKVLRGASALALVSSTALLAGCMSSPTYGTDKTASAQLVDDISGALNPVPKRKPPIAYKPRPDIVKPDNEQDAQVAALPVPQDNVATSSNPAWPESPEQRRARIRADATANRDNPDFVPEVAVATPGAKQAYDGRYETNLLSAESKKQREEFLRRKRETEQGSSAERKYLSDPPLDYRVPAATAASGELGEDEIKKEARRQREARKKGGKSSWRDLVPWL